MESAELIGNREKALIHVAKHQLGIDDDTYRAMLESVGVSSSKELDCQRFDEVMQMLRNAGFKPVHESARKSGMQHRPPRDRLRMLAYVESILAGLELPWSYADGIARKMFGIDRLRFCDASQTYKILQALIIYRKRKAGR